MLRRKEIVSKHTLFGDSVADCSTGTFPAAKECKVIPQHRCFDGFFAELGMLDFEFPTVSTGFYLASVEQEVEHDQERQCAASCFLIR